MEKKVEKEVETRGPFKRVWGLGFRGEEYWRIKWKGRWTMKWPVRLYKGLGFVL